MTQFGDQLRATLKKKSDQLFARQMQEERLLQAAKRLQDETRRAAGRLCREVFGPLLQEFREVLEAAGVLCGGAVQLDDAGSGAYTCRYVGMGGAPGTPHYEIRIVCSATAEGRIELAVECLDTTAAEFGGGAASKEQRPSACSPLPAPCSLPPARKPLIEFPPKSVAAVSINSDAVRQWCAALLKKCADACIEANGKRS